MSDKIINAREFKIRIVYNSKRVYYEFCHKDVKGDRNILRLENERKLLLKMLTLALCEKEGYAYYRIH